jgi:itaconyl-CoA hydratase
MLRSRRSNLAVPGSSLKMIDKARTLPVDQVFLNAHLAQSNPITGGRIIVNSGLTVALVLGLSVIDMSQNAVANLGWTDTRLTHPVYIGDTIYAESVCTGKRRSTKSNGCTGKRRCC